MTDHPDQISQSAAGGGAFALLRGCSEGGLAADLPPATVWTLRVAPSVTTEQFNTIRPGLFPIACWRLDDLRFGFDSSFVGPEAAQEFQHLAELMRRHPGAPLSIFGHADPVGNEAYNKRLSGRRAQAVYGALTRDIALWEALYSDADGGDDWAPEAVPAMLRALGYFEQPGAYAAVDPLRDAVYRFQVDAGCDADGDAGPQTRAALFAQYLDLLVRDHHGAPFHLTKDDFLARGADPGGKGDYQGCGEFNPVLLFSQQEKKELSAGGRELERNEENAPNRRVVILLFAPGTKVVAGRWPCPRANEDGDGCKTRFWSDSSARRQFQAERREFEQTHDTFACRFYHRLTAGSPCERGRRTIQVRIRLCDLYAQPIPHAPYRIAFGSYQTPELQADAEGYTNVPVPEAVDRCRVEWFCPPGHATPDDVDGRRFALTVYLNWEDQEEESQARQCLHNLGYPVRLDVPLASQAEVIRAFQRDYLAPECMSGVLDGPTLQKLKESNATCRTVKREDIWSHGRA